MTEARSTSLGIEKVSTKAEKKKACARMAKEKLTSNVGL